MYMLQHTGGDSSPVSAVSIWFESGSNLAPTLSAQLYANTLVVLLAWISLHCKLGKYGKAETYLMM